MRKSIKYYEVLVYGVKIIENEMLNETIDNFKYTGRKKSNTSFERNYSNLLINNEYDSIVVKQNEVSKIYEFDIEDLISISREVDSEIEE